MKKALGEDDGVTLKVLNILSLAWMKLGKWTEGEDAISRVVIKYKLILGKHHVETLTSLFNFTECLIHRNEWDEAEKILREVVEAQEKILGRDHPDSLQSRERLEYAVQQKELLQATDTNTPNIPRASTPSVTQMVDKNEG